MQSDNLVGDNQSSNQSVNLDLLQSDITIIGASVSGCLMGLFLRKQHPELNITVIADNNEKLPIVGESLTEFSTQLLHELGLTAYLEEDQYHKYGLTFYFKQDIDRPECRRYAVHEAPATPPLPSNQLNRFTFDRKIYDLMSQANVKIIKARAQKYDLTTDSGHLVTYKQKTGEVGQILSKWLVDASGRARFLTKQMQLQKQAPYQRSTVWFRLVDFDRNIFNHIDAVKQKQQAFDSYFVTHHFMGHANWMWLIPMRTPEYRDMISIGIVWRPDLREINIRNLDDFLAEVGKEHQVVCDLIRSGKVIDFERYHSYLHETKQSYSANGWFIVGDAGDAVDPLYSTGMVMNSIQIRQVSEMIRREKMGKLTHECISDFQNAYKIIRDTIQLEISRYFEVMHDAYEAHWRMHLISTQYFFFLLPCWLCGYMTSQRGTRFIKKVLEIGRQPYQELKNLGSMAAGKKKGVDVSELRNMYDISVNWRLWIANEADLPSYFATLSKRFIYYRFKLLKVAGWPNLIQHLFLITKDFVNFIMWSLIGMTSKIKLRDRYIFKKLIGYSKMPEKIIARPIISKVLNQRSANNGQSGDIAA